ncbi:MAG: T9SS type A sorting domain-containing protein [Ignavibacteria bacterium]|nr:T9SS type A sorting domain-containing protein [Ignavibacteria bacterium]
MRFKLSTILFFFILIVSSIHSQITLDDGDLTNFVNPGVVVYEYDDTVITSINIGSLGATLWDFSGLKTHKTLSEVSISPIGTPLASLYPDATHCFYYEDITLNHSSQSWTYYNKSNGFKELGTFQKYIAGTDTLTFRDKKIPYDYRYMIPLAYNTSWNISFIDSIFQSHNSLKLALYKNEYIERIVDAYGTMILPGGKSVEALRVKTDSRITTFQTSLPMKYERTIKYTFWAKTGNMVTFVALDTSATTGGVISIKGASWIIYNFTDINDLPVSPTQFILEQNYPNPFNPTTVISYQLPKNSFVTLKVYDVLGNEVAVLVNEEKQPGTYEVEFQSTVNSRRLASGFYFYAIQANALDGSKNFREVKKLILLK